MTFGDRFDKCSKISRTEFQHTSIAFISPWIHPMRKPPQRTLVRSGGSPPALRLLKEGGKVAKVICRRKHPTLLYLMNRNERVQKTERKSQHVQTLESSYPIYDSWLWKFRQEGCKINFDFVLAVPLHCPF